jgi:16S rRNA (cytidine1402-2'-O)-methyltransferase
VQRQYSFRDTSGRGTLYLVSTPIGNLGDLSPRAVETLKHVQVIAAEDTRQTRKLLTHFSIEGPRLISYHEHNKHRMESEILEMLKQGDDVAIVTDAGTPGISDPGEDLVRVARENGYPVTSIPGPCAAISALVISGLPTGRFTFIGFLPREKKARREELNALRKRPETLIFYEAPHRLKETAKDLSEILGGRKVSVARELTKRFEEVAFGDLNALVDWLEEEIPRGEYVLVVEGFQGELETDEQESSWWECLTLSEHVEKLVEKGIDKKDAIKQVAKQRGLPKREVYQATLSGRMDK